MKPKGQTALFAKAYSILQNNDTNFPQLLLDLLKVRLYKKMTTLDMFLLI